MSLFRVPSTSLILAAVFVVGGCAGPAVRYYSLAGPFVATAGNGLAAGTGGAANGATAGANGAAGTGASGQSVHIEVAPVGVPERLARPQMLIRNPDGGDKGPVGPQVAVLEQQRWASSLDSELRDAFAGAIASKAGAVDVTRGGRLPGRPVYRIAIRVGYLDAILDRQVDAVFGWTITRSDDPRHAICDVSVSRPAGPGMDALVEAVKQVVAVAAGRIAEQLGQLQATGTATCEPPAGRSAAGSSGPASGAPAAAVPAAAPAAGSAAASGSTSSASPAAGADAKPSAGRRTVKRPSRARHSP